MSVKRITPSQRFSHAHPCPVCGGHKDISQGKGMRCYGWMDDDEKFVHCTREEFANGAKYDAESQTFLHVRDIDGISYRPWTPTAPTQLHSVPPRPRSIPQTPSTPTPSEHASGKTHPRVGGTTYFNYGAAQRIERKDSLAADGSWKKDCFSQHRANGTWAYGDGPGIIERIYRRDALISSPRTTVYLFEGERKAEQGQELLSAEGVAISWRGGCGNLRKSLPAIVEAARGREMVLVTDSDREGRDAMQTIAAAIHGTARSVRILDLYGDESKRDIEDWLHEGGTPAAFRSLIDGLAEYVPPADDEADTAQMVRRFRAYTASEMKARPPISFRVENLIPETSFVTIIGKPGVLKTFVGIDLGLSIATGAPWHGRETKQGSVLYVSAEGAAGFGQRIAAWEAARYREAPDTFRVVTDAPQLLIPDDVEAIISTASDDLPAVIFIDTLARTIGGDENSTRDMSDYVSAVNRIQRATAATIVVIHHMGWNADRGRGSSALFAGVDAEITIERDDRTGPMTLKVTKAKEFAEPMPLTLTPRVIDLENGASSLVLEQQATDFAELTGTMKRIGLILHDTFGLEGATATKWEEVCVSSEGISTASFFRARKDLVEGGFVQSSGEKRGARYTITDEFRIKVSLGISKVSDTNEGLLSRYHPPYRGDTLIPSASETIESGDDDDFQPGTVGRETGVIE